MDRSLPTTRVEVNLDAVVANARDVKALVGPGTGILAMLKADAYGHGLVPIARAIERDGTVDGMVVTSLRDGLALRQAGVEAKVIVMTSSYAGQHGAVVDADLVPVIASPADLEGFAIATRARGVAAAVHVKMDTGMSRLGLREDEIEPFLARVAKHSHIVIDGICTHLSSADADGAEVTHAQLDRFERSVARFRAAGHRPAMLHAANTAATFRHPRAHFTHVRTGIALFGGDEPSGARLRPALRFITHVAHVRAIGAGESVSYGEKWRATRPSRIATLPIGYAQGYPRRLFGRAEVLIRGRRCPVVGTICMEMILVDVTGLDVVELGDEVTLVGMDGEDEIRADDLARAIDGIVEEIFCGIAKSVPRDYVGGMIARLRTETLRIPRDMLSSRPLS